jgi:hypothetical protein
MKLVEIPGTKKEITRETKLMNSIQARTKILNTCKEALMNLSRVSIYNYFC